MASLPNVLVVLPLAAFLTLPLLRYRRRRRLLLFACCPPLRLVLAYVIVRVLPPLLQHVGVFLIGLLLRVRRRIIFRLPFHLSRNRICQALLTG